MLELKNRSTRPVLNPGDIVCLKSNPETVLTVSFVVGSPENPFNEDHREMGLNDGDVQCKWEYGSKFKFLFLYAAMLEKKKTISFFGKKIIQFPTR